MSAERTTGTLSPEDYLKGEIVSPVKHEYIDGRVYAMAGASLAHGTVTANLIALIWPHVRGSGYLAFVADVKVHVEPANAYYYPDLVVTCDARDQDNEYVLQHPCLIIEVPSPSTAAFDRGRKFSDYQKLESLQEYIIVAPDRMSVDCFRRVSERESSYTLAAGGQEVVFSSIGLTCPIEAIYEDIDIANDEGTGSDGGAKAD